MTAPARSQITAAIFQLVADLNVFRAKATRLRNFPQVPVAERPAIFVTSDGETYTGKAPNLRTRTIRYRVWVYLAATDDNLGIDQIDSLLDALDAVFAPSGKDVTSGAGLNTLGGLVQWCVIDGNVVKIPGDLDGTGEIILPFLVMTIP